MVWRLPFVMPNDQDRVHVCQLYNHISTLSIGHNYDDGHLVVRTISKREGVKVPNS